MKLIAYPAAAKFLAHRLDATPEELAAWVWMGPEFGGLAAYLNANELNPPPRFFYDIGDGMDFDYISPLMACWFYENDITNFQPANRFITGRALVERWSEYAGIEAEAFIQAKIAESRLLSIHPMLGGTQGVFPYEDTYPPLESGLFVLSHVEEIETADFGGEESNKAIASKPTYERNRNLQRDANALADQWKQQNRKMISRREIAKALATSDEWKEMTASRIERVIHREW